MTTYRSPPSGSYYTSHWPDRATISYSRPSQTYNRSTFHDDTRCSRPQRTSDHTSFCPTRRDPSLRDDRSLRYHQHYQSPYDPNPGYSVSGTRRTKDPTHTYEPNQSVSGFRLWKNRPPTKPTTEHSPALDPAALRSCLKGANGSRSRLPSVAFRVPDTNQTKTSHDSRTVADRLFSRFRNLSSSLRTKAPRTRAVYHHKSRRGPKKKKKNRKHKRRESTKDTPDSTYPRYTQRTRHHRKHATERSENDHEKRHNRRTHRQVTERHTSHSVPMRKETRPSEIRTERRTKHQRARNPSEVSEWYVPRTARTRTHHARASRNRCAPRCREIPTTRTRGYRYR
jgi:hypothetical protein